MADGAHALVELDFARLCRARGIPAPTRQAVRHGPRGRIYLDVGTEEGAGTLRDAKQLAATLKRKGYREGESLVFMEDHGGRHDESHWGRRLVPALEFLLSPFAFPIGRR